MNAIAGNRASSFVASLFRPDHDRHEGVRPIQIHLLRVLYLLMFVGVGLPTWGEVLRHAGPWDQVRAVAACVWVAYPTLGVLGLLNPLRMLPLVVFMLFYKTLWLAVVAWPLWSGGQLAASPANEMAHVFAGVIAIYPIVPWGHVLRTWLRLPARTRAAR